VRSHTWGKTAHPFIHQEGASCGKTAVHTPKKGGREKIVPDNTMGERDHFIVGLVHEKTVGTARSSQRSGDYSNM